MNCLEFRREAMARPESLGPEALSHAARCETCRALHEQVVRLERDVAEAACVPVPAGLAERILAGRRRSFAPPRRGLLALAAVLVLAIALGILSWPRRDDPLARAGIDFVVDQEVSAILNAKPADPGALRRVTAALDVDLPERVGKVRYIGICPFEGTIAHHVVVMTPEGKATLLLFPEKPIRAKGGASARGLRSIAKPAGVGSVVIVGPAETVRRVEEIVTHG